MRLRDERNNIDVKAVSAEGLLTTTENVSVDNPALQKVMEPHNAALSSVADLVHNEGDLAKDIKKNYIDGFKRHLGHWGVPSDIFSSSIPHSDEYKITCGPEENEGSCRMLADMFRAHAPHLLPAGIDKQLSKINYDRHDDVFNSDFLAEVEDEKPC